MIPAGDSHAHDVGIQFQTRLLHGAEPEQYAATEVPIHPVFWGRLQRGLQGGDSKTELTKSDFDVITSSAR